ncbi:MAG: HlyC/CorC family transporter [Pseudomonadales bacterium]|jgi:Mg2+/Co2+ transporter CorB|nr:HlyC/CorC family transporter [Pseudomonadales bacterium]
MSSPDAPLWLLIGSIVVFTAISAYFSGTETSMMALNRYRLKHLVKQRHRGARKANRLLRRPDRLLGAILVGNNLVNFSAATIATVIGFRLFGDTGVLLAPWVITIIFLIFAEVAPKTLAAQHPERWAFKSVFILQPLSRFLHPAVLFVNWIANALLRPFSSKNDENDENLSTEELKTVVNEGAISAGERQNMMVRLLDLERVSVNDIMVPRHEIIGLDIDSDLIDLIDQTSSSQHTLLPVYKGEINNVIGILHLRRLAKFLHAEEFNKADLMQLTREPYYVPEATPLHTQLLNFQKEKQRIALVVDEYGDVQGIVTLEDILEEIVGEFTTDFASRMPEILPQDDGSFLIDGMALLRDINRALRWALPIHGPKTLNGLVLEHLETIPESNLCLTIDNYQIETLQIKDNIVKSLKVHRVEVPEDSEASDADDD